jgi:hypothetical protein
MAHGDWILFWLIGLAVFGIWAGVSYFSPSAKLHRRRRKSHTPVKPKGKGPMVRFSVRPPKK